MARSERDKILEKYRNAIVGGMARTLWVNAYMAWAEEDPDERDPDAYYEIRDNDADWYDMAPETPDPALDAADELASLYEDDEGTSLVDLYILAIEADTRKQFELDELIGAGRPEALPTEFGNALANMALSTGVSWFDDHKKFPLQRPSFECHYDGDSLIWSGRGLRKHGSGNQDVENDADNVLRIRTAFEDITPESAEDGQAAETGFIDDDGEEFVNVRDAVAWLRDRGPFEPSSSSPHSGIWYTHYGEADYRDGTTRNLSYHIAGATLTQELRIYDLLAKAGVLSGAKPRAKNRGQHDKVGKTRPNPSRAELRDVGFVQSSIKGSIDSEFKQKVASIVLKPGPTGKVPTEENFKRDLAANLTMGVLLDDEGEECGCEHKNPPGRFTEKGERMFQDVKLEYERKGEPRAAELAARTVYAEAKKGVPGLLNVGPGRPPGVPNPGRFKRL